MRIELRERPRADGKPADVGAVLICESEHESQIVDTLFGNKVLDADGLIARRQVEVRLSDGYAEHYIYVVPAGLEK